MLSVILEGESLFNDASSLTMFEVSCATFLTGSGCGHGHLKQLTIA